MSQPSDRPESRDLPPVEPPTAGFIIQLFVLPAIVVAVLIVVWLLFGRLAGGERSASDYVQKIKSDSGDWRSAFDLASLIQNDASLARDPKLLGELTDLLDLELRRKESNPKLNQYLVLSLGVFQTLETRSKGGPGTDPVHVLAEALAPEQPPDVRTAAAESLARQAARLNGGLDHSEAVSALARTAKEAEEPELRQRAVYALGFFSGDRALAALRERVSGDEDRPVRYNAAAALARRGDPAALPVLREMLSPKDLEQVIKSETQSETQHRIEAIELEALRSLQAAERLGKTELAERVRTDLNALVGSNLAGVRNEAKAVLKGLPSAP
jgi:hypothetical protein